MIENRNLPKSNSSFIRYYDPEIDERIPQFGIVQYYFKIKF
jgi:hypothetical protein